MALTWLCLFNDGITYLHGIKKFVRYFKDSENFQSKYRGLIPIVANGEVRLGSKRSRTGLRKHLSRNGCVHIYIYILYGIGVLTIWHRPC